MYITVLKPFDDIGTRVIIGVVDNWFENELISNITFIVLTLFLKVFCIP